MLRISSRDKFIEVHDGIDLEINGDRVIIKVSAAFSVAAQLSGVTLPCCGAGAGLAGTTGGGGGATWGQQ